MTTNEPDFVSGNVLNIIFESNDSFFKILNIKITDTNLKWNDDTIVVTGSFADIKPDAAYTFHGQLVSHPKYGEQLKTTEYEVQKPTTKDGLVAYLSSDKFNGIGEKTAQKIVDALGPSAIDKILADKSVLNPIGITKARQEELVETLRENHGIEQVIIGLNRYGFGNNLAYQIYQRYQEQTLEVIEENPYRLANEIEGIGFKRADAIAQEQGIAADSNLRIESAVLQVVDQQTYQTGDTYTDAKTVLGQTLGLLESSRVERISPELIADALIELAKKGDVISEENRIYLKNMFDAEWQIANQFKRVLDDSDTNHFTESQISSGIKRIEKRLDIQYDDIQKSAISKALTNQVLLLTGGPGTGKTTIINGIVELFAELNQISLDVNEYKETPFPILLAAPTGRAAKNIAETTNLPAGTLHRLLGLTGRESKDEVETKDLTGGLLVVDEMSMVDTYLFKTLIRAIPVGMKMILVGDRDQLPSVGPGQVFSDLLKSNVLPKIELNQIHRQEEGSSIVSLAHEINKGEVPADLLEKKNDRSFIPCHANQVESVIRQIVASAQKKGFTTDDIQSLVPMYKGAAGINALNPMIQNIMNPKKTARTKEVESGIYHYRIGDKVLQLVNSPELNVFNGEIGKIVGISLASESKDKKEKSDKLTIAFADTEVTYAKKDWNKITLAYCTSIHKAQGSEFKMVILPLVKQFSRMLKRNLLYTAITRASELLIMIGEPVAFEEAIKTTSTNRKTSLIDRLQTVFEFDKSTSVDDHEQTTINHDTNETKSVDDKEINSEIQPSVKEEEATYLTIQAVASHSIDPMIGMDGISPQDFMKK